MSDAGRCHVPTLRPVLGTPTTAGIERCSHPFCTTPNRHRTGCEVDCLGCLPAPVRPGYGLCPGHTARIPRDALTLLAMFSALAQGMTPGPGLGLGLTGIANRAPGLSLDPAVVDRRTEIRTVLRRVAAYLGAPDDGPERDAQIIARCPDRLACSVWGWQLAVDLEELADDRQLHALAWPSNAYRAHPAGTCLCGHPLSATGRATYVTCASCGSSTLLTDLAGMTDRRGIDAYAAAAWLAVRYDRSIEPATVRKWAERGHVERSGVDERGRVLLDLESVVSYAAKLWGAPAGRHPTAAL